MQNHISDIDPLEKWTPPSSNFNALTETSNVEYDKAKKDQQEGADNMPPAKVDPFNFKHDVILPEFKPKYAIFINRSSWVSIQQAISICKTFSV